MIERSAPLADSCPGSWTDNINYVKINYAHDTHAQAFLQRLQLMNIGWRAPVRGDRRNVPSVVGMCAENVSSRLSLHRSLRILTYLLHKRAETGQMQTLVTMMRGDSLIQLTMTTQAARRDNRQPSTESTTGSANNAVKIKSMNYTGSPKSKPSSFISS